MDCKIKFQIGFSFFHSIFVWKISSLTTKTDHQVDKIIIGDNICEFNSKNSLIYFKRWIFSH